jgi:hypothetical protein
MVEFLVSGAIPGWVATWILHHLRDRSHQRQQRKRIGVTQPLQVTLWSLPWYAVWSACFGMICPVLFLVLTPPVLLDLIPTSIVLKNGWTFVAAGIYGFWGGLSAGSVYALLRITEGQKKTSDETA